MTEHRLETGQWPTGVSGNPGGYSKEKRAAIARVADLAREHTPAAIATLASIMQDEKAPRASRIAASNALLDRAWGRPPQSVELELPGSSGDGLDQLMTRFDVARRIAFTLQHGALAMEQLPSPINDEAVSVKE